MILISLELQDNIPNIRHNHQEYCKVHRIKYENCRIYSLYHKYHSILEYLNKFKNETLIFIDSNTYFMNNLTIDIGDLDGAIQVDDSDVVDGIFVLKATERNIKIFNILLMNIISNLKLKKESNIKSFLPKDLQVVYPYFFNNKCLQLNAVRHSDIFNLRGIITCNLYDPIYERRVNHFADILSRFTAAEYPSYSGEFEIFNPGKENCLITMYTPNISKIGTIAETNFKRYCKDNHLTLYIYRDIPKNLNGMNGNWCKPYLILNHLKDHTYTAWIDSDILITNSYKFKFESDIMVYNDPCVWEFNSGYMAFKNTDKNIDLLNSVISRFDNLDSKASTYVNGGDQTYFIEEYFKYYPSKPPISNSNTNAHPCFPRTMLPTEPAMIHFMGIYPDIRWRLMDWYEQMIAKDYANYSL